MRKLLLLTSLSFTLAVNLLAQDNPNTTKKDEVRVFIDCDWRCDISYIKTEINFVDFMPDRFTANVYILITSQNTGSDGEEIKMFFSGQENFKGLEDTLTFYRSSVNTDDEYRQNLVKFLKLGLVQYISKTSIAQKLSISVPAAAGEEALNTLTTKKDKWNFWVFNIGLNGFLNSDDHSKSYRLNSRIGASRVTEKLKIDLSANVSESGREINFRGIKTKFPNSGSGFNSTIVRSITPHWSAGGYASYTHSTFSNFDQKFTINPAIEYSFFPYKDAVKKSVTLFYQAGPSFGNYIDSGYYDTPERYSMTQSLSLNIGFIQKWGNISSNLSWENFLNSFTLKNSKINGKDINKFTIGGNVELRIVKGLSFNVSSYANFTKGIYPNIPRKYFSRDDLLTNARQYPTQKSLFVYFGINYRFGSIYSNVVNPRFKGGGGGTRMFFF